MVLRALYPPARILVTYIVLCVCVLALNSACPVALLAFVFCLSEYHCLYVSLSCVVQLLSRQLPVLLNRLITRSVFRVNFLSRLPACMAGGRRGAFTCVGWQVTLCDPIWQVTCRSSLRWGSHEELYRPLPFLPFELTWQR